MSSQPRQKADFQGKNESTMRRITNPMAQVSDEWYAQKHTSSTLTDSGIFPLQQSRHNSQEISPKSPRNLIVWVVVVTVVAAVDADNLTSTAPVGGFRGCPTLLCAFRGRVKTAENVTDACSIGHTKQPRVTGIGWRTQKLQHEELRRTRATW